MRTCMANVQALFNNYLNIKFNRGLPAVPMEDFEYAVLEDQSAELFSVLMSMKHFWRGQRSFNLQIHSTVIHQMGNLYFHRISISSMFTMSKYFTMYTIPLIQLQGLFLVIHIIQ